MKTETLVLVGAGNLAHALVQGWSRSGTDWNVRVLARSPVATPNGWSVPIATDPAVLSQANAIVVAVKPKDAAPALSTIRQYAPPDAVVTSVMAGIRLDHLAQALPGLALARAMPNIASAIGQGTTVLCTDRLNRRHAAAALALWAALGYVLELPEAALDPATAVSGSGPAYGFLLLQAMLAAGVSLGLEEPTARALAAHTLQGAAALAAAQPDVSLDALTRLVASPGGTTEAALQALDDQAVGHHIQTAIRQAGEKAQALGQMPRTSS